MVKRKDFEQLLITQFKHGYKKKMKRQLKMEYFFLQSLPPLCNLSLFLVGRQKDEAREDHLGLQSCLL